MKASKQKQLDTLCVAIGRLQAKATQLANDPYFSGTKVSHAMIRVASHLEDTWRIMTDSEIVK